MIVRTIKTNVQIVTMALCMVATSAMGLEYDVSEREKNLLIIQNFLTHPDIADAMTNKHGKNINKLMKKVNKLDDEQLAALAADTENLMQYGAAEGTQRVESDTAERISDKWLQLGYIAILVPVALLLLLLIL